MLGKRATSSHCLDSSRQGEEQPRLTGGSCSGIGTRGANVPSIAQRKLFHNPSQIPSAKSPLGETQRATISCRFRRGMECIPLWDRVIAHPCPCNSSPDYDSGSRSKGPLTLCVNQPCNPSPEFEYIPNFKKINRALTRQRPAVPQPFRRVRPV